MAVCRSGDPASNSKEIGLTTRLPGRKAGDGNIHRYPCGEVSTSTVLGRKGEGDKTLGDERRTRGIAAAAFMTIGQGTRGLEAHASKPGGPRVLSSVQDRGTVKGVCRIV